MSGKVLLVASDGQGYVFGVTDAKFWALVGSELAKMRLRAGFDRTYSAYRAAMLNVSVLDVFRRSRRGGVALGGRGRARDDPARPTVIGSRLMGVVLDNSLPRIRDNRMGVSVYQDVSISTALLDDAQCAVSEVAFAFARESLEARGGGPVTFTGLAELDPGEGVRRFRVFARTT